MKRQVTLSTLVGTRRYDEIGVGRVPPLDWYHIAVAVPAAWVNAAGYNIQHIMQKQNSDDPNISSGSGAAPIESFKNINVLEHLSNTTPDNAIISLVGSTAGAGMYLCFLKYKNYKDSESFGPDQAKAVLEVQVFIFNTLFTTNLIRELVLVIDRADKDQEANYLDSLTRGVVLPSVAVAATFATNKALSSGFGGYFSKMVIPALNNVKLPLYLIGTYMAVEGTRHLRDQTIDMPNHEVAETAARMAWDFGFALAGSAAVKITHLPEAVDKLGSVLSYAWTKTKKGCLSLCAKDESVLPVTMDDGRPSVQETSRIYNY